MKMNPIRRHAPRLLPTFAGAVGLTVLDQAVICAAPAPQVPHQQAALDAEKMEPFRRRNKQYTTLENDGKTPGPWQPASWADGAVSEAALVADAGDGKPALRFVNVSGQPSLMFKPWTEVSLSRGGWVARIEYRKSGKTGGDFVVEGLPDGKKAGVRLPATGGAFATVSLPLEVSGSGAAVRLAFQLYEGVGENEALFVRRFRLEPAGDVSAETKAAEAERAAALLAAARIVAAREAARRAAERKPLKGWVRPENKPVPMTKPLEPPPVTGKTYFVAPTGDDGTGDGSKDKPWRTIQHGMDRLHPGDRLYLRGGEYRESMLTLARSGKPDAYITVAGYPGERAKVINSGGLAVFNLDAGSPWTPKRLREEAYIVFRDLYVDAVKGNQTFRINGPMMLPEYGSDVVKARGLRHNIWIVGCEIVGGGAAEGGIGAGFGAHDIVISNNRIHHISGGVMAYLYADGTIIEWNTIHNTGPDQDDAGAIKSMTPGVIIRYNTVHANNRDPLSKKPGWAPDSEGGGQWRFLQGVTGIYLDWAMRTPPGGNGFYPEPLAPADPANYVYGNRVFNNNAGIYVYKSDHARVFDNIVYGNGRANTGGWAEGKEGGKWLEFIGPAGYGIAATASNDVRVYGNLVYDNRLGGLTTETVPGFQAFNNVLFGNDLAQIHVRKGDEGAFGFNRIVAVPKQGVPFRRVSEDFATPAAYRQKYPYQDEGTEIVPLKTGAEPLPLAEKLRKEKAIPEARWREAVQTLTERARRAGVGEPPRTVPQAAYDPTQSLQAPLPWRVPGVIEMENYDVGGPGVSFQDNDPENQGGHYRKDGVDTKASARAGNGAVVGFTLGGEWMEYSVSVQKAGSYRIAVAYATPEAGRRVRLTWNGEPLGEAITFAKTAGWDDLRTAEFGAVALPQGDGVLRVTVESGPVDLDRIEFKPAP